MAKGGAKKRLEENAATLKRLSTTINAAIAFHVVVRVLLRRRSVTKWKLFLALFTALVSRWSLRSLESYAKPTFGENGEVLDGGESLRGGLTEYYQDLIYVGAFALVATTYSDKFWWVTLIVPGIATYMIVTKFVLPYMLAPREAEEAERKETREEKKRRERSERRAQRKFR